MATLTDLHEDLISAIPPTGKIEYRALEAALVASGKRDALKAFRNAKQRGELKAEIIVNPDGSISHNVWRVTP